MWRWRSFRSQTKPICPGPLWCGEAARQRTGSTEPKVSLGRGVPVGLHYFPRFRFRTDGNEKAVARGTEKAARAFLMDARFP
jgi:hypothetical protein